MKVVIMAGGRGSRISEIASDIPKPLIKIDGKTVIENEIQCLQKQGFFDFIITVSHMAEQIIQYLGNGDKLGVQIEYYIENQPLGNAGALFRISHKLSDDFLLINADSIFDINLQRLIVYHQQKRGIATIFTHPNDHPFDSGLIISNKDGSVERWLTKEDDRPQWYKNRVNAGIHILNKQILNDYNALSMSGRKIDLDRDLLKPLAGSGRLFCYDSPEYIKDMGTPERLECVKRDFESGLIAAKSLCRKQKAIFLDRDGTINKYVGFLTDIEDFELLEGVAEAIRLINRSGYLAIIITNQPVIARGEIDENYLGRIHCKMETLLGKEGAYIDAVYYCPHHPDKGYVGEIPELKVDCDCRKPKPGLFIQASEDFNINLEESWMVGDSKNDITAGFAAGCKTVLIGNKDFGQTMTVNSLLEFVKQYLRK